eukprot:4024223-Alexandrium_andersonii.AAC.1
MAGRPQTLCLQGFEGSRETRLFEDLRFGGLGQPPASQSPLQIDSGFYVCNVVKILTEPDFLMIFAVGAGAGSISQCVAGILAQPL